MENKIRSKRGACLLAEGAAVLAADSDIKDLHVPSMIRQNVERNNLIPEYVMNNIKTVYAEQRLQLQTKPILEQPKQAPLPGLSAVTELKSESFTKLRTTEHQLSLFDDFAASKRADSIEEIIGIAATQIARAVNSNCIVSIERSRRECTDEQALQVKVVIFKKEGRKGYCKSEYDTRMAVTLNGSVLPIKELLIEAITLKYIAKGDRIVCVGDESVGMGYKGLIFIFDVDKIFFNMGTHHLTDKISADVIESTINTALEIGREGREGRRIGTAFIIGNKSDIMKHTKQLILNPFSSYPEDRRSIKDPTLRETIKGFAQLDGVFMVDESGSILSAGTLINVNIDSVELPSMEGFGTRHRASAAITKVTDAVAVVVSESGGTVRVIKDGKIVMKLP